MLTEWERWGRRWYGLGLVLKLLLVVVMALGGYAFAGSPVGLLIGLIPVPVLLSKELFAVLAWISQNFRRFALRDLEGSLYAFKGQAVRVAEPVPGERWLALDDLARVLRESPGLPGLQQRYPDGVMQIGRRWFISAPDCLDYLQHRSHPRALQLRTWVDRVVWQPSGQARRHWRR